MSQSWLSPDVEAEKQQAENWQETPADNAPAASSSSGAATFTPGTSSSEKKGRECTFWLNLFISVVLVILFIVAASVEWNDAKGAIMWGIFYIVHAVLAIVGTLRFFMCKRMLTKPILFVSGCILIWSIVLLCLAAVDLSRTKKGGSKGGGDAKNRTYREEIGYELGGSILGCLSCIYFFCMCMCCDKAPSANGD